MRFTGSFQTTTDQPRAKASFSLSSTSISGLASVPGLVAMEGQPPACPISEKIRVRPEADPPSIPRCFRVNIFAPRIDSTCDILDFSETCIVKQFPRLPAARSVLTIKPDFPRAIQFMHPLAEFRQRYLLRMRNLRDLRLERLANIEQVDLRRDFSRLDRRLHVLDIDFLHMHRLDLLRRGHSAEKIVIDQLRDRLICSAQRTFRVLAQLQFTKL